MPVWMLSTRMVWSEQAQAMRLGDTLMMQLMILELVKMFARLDPCLKLEPQEETFEVGGYKAHHYGLKWKKRKRHVCVWEGVGMGVGPDNDYFFVFVLNILSFGGAGQT